MNIHDSSLAGSAMVEALAQAGLAGLTAMERVLGAGGVARASDLHRLVDAQLVDADALAAFLSGRYGVRLLAGDALDELDIAASDLSPRFLVDNWLLPLRAPDGSRLVGALHPGDSEPIDALLSVLEDGVEVCVISAPDMEARLERLAGGSDAGTSDETAFASEEAIADLRDMASGAPVVMAVDDIFRRAIDLRATDIHLEPMRGRLVLRFRIDGVLRVMAPPPLEMGEPIVSRVKVLAGLDIAERRRPQDGGMRLKVRDRDIEMRVATLPSIHGETLVLRILQRDGALVDLGSIGLRGRDTETLHHLLEHTHGMIVVAGPTGSGKTTTLAAALSRLNDPGRKIVTIEDPVEYQIPGIVQSQVQPAIDLTFSSAIRAFVRQDPDIILVGEIRDPETARAAIQAGLTGHLVLTTVHANTAAAAFTRLRDLGIENYLLVGAVRGVVAQRLVRRLCEHCKRPMTIKQEMLDAEPRYAAVGFAAGDSAYAAVGCARCADAGYRGRIAVFEILTLSDEVVTLASEGSDNARIEAAALRAGMTTMADDAVSKARDGLTSPAEVVRVTALR